MGQSNSKIISEEELVYLEHKDVFTRSQICHLYKRFKHLDKLNVNYLTFSELQMIPEFFANPFYKLILNYIERNNNYERISFIDFLNYLSIFSDKSPTEKRIKYLFDIFDIHQKGYLDKLTLKTIMNLMNINEDLNKTFSYFNKEYLNYDDFAQLYDSQMEENLIIKFPEN